MPKIPEYNTQVQMSGRPQTESGGRSLGSIQSESRATQGLINAAVDAGSALYKRAAQNEISDLNAQFAQARAEWETRIDEETKSGTIDTQKLESDFDDFAYKMNEGINTAEGRGFYERQTSRLKASVIRSGARAQAQVAGLRAEQNLKTKLQHDTLALQRNPGLFKDLQEESVDFVDTNIQAGGIAAIHRDKFLQHINSELATSTIQGMAQQDPNKAQLALESGEFDQYISGDQRGQAMSYIKAQREVKRIEAERAETQARKWQAKQSEAWQQEALGKLTKGSLQTDDILKAPMDSSDKIRWLKLADEAAKDDAKTDPRILNDLTRRTLLPDSDPKKIRGIADLAPWVGNGISINDAENINGFIQKTPDGAYDTDNRKRLIDFATAKLVKKDAFSGYADPDGEYNMSRFNSALQMEEQRFRKEGKDPGLLYDPYAKEYFGNRVAKYQKNPQEILQIMASQATKEASNPPPPAGSYNQHSQAPAKNNPSGHRVRVQSPEGKTGTVPAEELQKYLMQGYREI